MGRDYAAAKDAEVGKKKRRQRIEGLGYKDKDFPDCSSSAFQPPGLPAFQRN
jgi:hypothetical protein